MKETLYAPELTRRSLGLLLLATILTLSQRAEVYLPFCLNWPVVGENQITQKFTYFHQGIDIAARKGTPVVATSEAKVVDVVSEEELPGALGNFTQISTLINGERYLMTYAHLQEISDLQVGQELLRGQLVGRVGSTGNSTGPHLHLEITQEAPTGEKVPLNPLPFFYNCQKLPNR